MTRLGAALRWLADRIYPKCEVCGARVRGWRTLIAHAYVNHPGEA